MDWIIPQGGCQQGVAIYFWMCQSSDMDSKHHLYCVTPPALIGRNRRMRELADEGKSYADISRMYGITGERVRQIVERERKTRKAA